MGAAGTGSEDRKVLGARARRLLRFGVAVLVSSTIQKDKSFLLNLMATLRL